MGVEHSLVNMTPARARALLETSEQAARRKIRGAQVDRIKRDIESGNWRNNHDPVRVSVDGVLLDGHHRMSAIVAAGIPVEVTLVSNFPEELVVYVDQGSTPRSVADSLTMTGRPTSNRDVAIARLLYVMERGETWNTSALSITELGETLARWHTEVEWTRRIPSRIPPGITSGGAPAMAAFAFCRRHPRGGALDRLVENFISDSGQADITATALRRVVAVTAVGMHGQQPRLTILHKTLWACYAALHNRPRSKLSGNSSVLQRLREELGFA